VLSHRRSAAEETSPKMSQSLFERENKLLDRYQEILDRAHENDASSAVPPEEFASLLEEYRKLLRQSKRLVKLSDRNELTAREANKSLEAALEELKQTQAELVQAEKMASLGQLVAGVAHEINTPLGIILTAASSLEEETRGLKKLAEDGQARKSDVFKYFVHAEETAHLIATHGNNAATLIHSFKRVSVNQSQNTPDSFDLKALIEDTLRSLGPRFKGTGVDISLDVPEGIFMRSYPGTLVQVLNNLVMNALIHGFENRHGGAITISTEPTKQGESIALRIADTGRGITPEIREKIFDPFVTTKRGQGGSGLGLNIVFNLITSKLQGKIILEDRTEDGTSFLMTLPREIGTSKED